MSLFHFFCFLLFPGSVIAQTCCSGGVPVSANIGFPSGEKKQLQFGIGYDYNQITRLYNARNILDNNNRKRSTQSYLIRASYQWQRRFATELFVPFVRQSRNIQTLSNTNDREISLGLGDPAILMSYDWLNTEKVNWTSSLGLRLPLGSFSETNDRGLLLINDMQPGSGAFDFIFRNALNLPFAKQPGLLFFFNSIYTWRGENRRYLGSQNYRFGQDLQAIAGFSRNIFALKQIWPLALGLRYRYTTADQQNQNELPNTGGEWLYARLNLGLAFNPATQLQLGLEIPFYTHLQGVQLSSHYQFNLTYLGEIKFKKDEF
ncbi:MAG: transporter [Haliscomenobacter sp.]|uniref:transporter n=1 Tax=Haliscomenobacter sp. TaxID=2717303 RepID=UPI0029B17DBA|nr:transporter [Haliscomenobacter sp.]MDX2069034.1 transporter [Haliscomenobacter sp.]